MMSLYVTVFLVCLLCDESFADRCMELLQKIKESLGREDD